MPEQIYAIFRSLKVFWDQLLLLVWSLMFILFNNGKSYRLVHYVRINSEKIGSTDIRRTMKR